MIRQRYGADPLIASPPLIEDGVHQAGDPVRRPSAELIDSERQRAEAELMHALDKHRRAWLKMNQLADAYREKGNAYFKDNERPWKEAVADVQWWRGEVNARSNSLVALLQLAASRNIDPMDGYVEVSTLADVAEGRRVLLRGRQRSVTQQTVADIVRGWDPNRPPTQAEFNAAVTWKNVAGADSRRMQASDLKRCEQIIAAGSRTGG